MSLKPPATIHRNNQITICAISLAILALSLPCEWLTSPYPVRFGNFPGFEYKGGSNSISIDAIHGHLNAGVNIPLWCIPAIGITGVIIHLLNTFNITWLPKAAATRPVVASSLLAIATIIMIASNNNANLGLGPILILVATVIFNIGINLRPPVIK